MVFDVDINNHIERLALLGLYFTLSLVLVFGSVSSSSHAYADDMMGMPSPQDAPATTDALTAGGGPDDDDDDNDSGDDSGGSQDSDDDNDNDKDKDNDKDDEPIPKDAPATADTLTAKNLECPEGQEVPLFSTTCKPADGGSDSTEGTTSAATVCPTSPTPTSHSTQDESAVTNAVWGFNNDKHEIKTEERDSQQTLLHRMATPERPGVIARDLPPEYFSDIFPDPAVRAKCIGQPVEVTNPDGTETTHNPDGTKNIKKSDANGVATVDRYDADNKLTSSDKIDPDSGRKVKETKYIPGTGARTSETTFNPYNGRPLQTTEYSPKGTRTSETTFSLANGKPLLKTEFNPNGETKSHTSYFEGTDKPARVSKAIYSSSGKVIGVGVTAFKADGSTNYKQFYPRLPGDVGPWEDIPLSYKKH